MRKTTRRTVLSCLALGVTAGCADQPTEPPSEPPNEPPNEQPSDKSSGKPTITQIKEVEPPDKTPKGSNTTASATVFNDTNSTGSYPVRTGSAATLFREQPSENAVIVARTIITNGCRKRVINHSHTPPNKYTVTLSRESQDLDGITCQATFEPSPYAIKIMFDELEPNINLSVDVFGPIGKPRTDKTYQYTTTGKNKNTIKK